MDGYFSSWLKRYCVAAFNMSRHWRLLTFVLTGIYSSLALVVLVCMFCFTISLHLFCTYNFSFIFIYRNLSSKFDYHIKLHAQ
jgi:hypothetical protein